jgi:hypothetical protein
MKRILRMHEQGLFGWVPDRPRSNLFAQEVGRLGDVSPIVTMGDLPKELHLWEAILKVKPDWRRGAQGIGDCASWGTEWAGTCLMAMQDVKGISRFIEEAATESIYGGMRVEALGKRTAGFSDGAFGAAGAKWLRDWGVTLRIDYSQQTGNREHDLRRYSKARAKQWGNYGCGGSDDQGKLDAIAQQFPVEHVVQIRSAQEAIQSLRSGYPCTIASMAGFEGMRRDSNGFVAMRGKWPHLMALGGVRPCPVHRGEWNARVIQSWGDSCSGPDPGVESDAMNACSWWIHEKELDWICKSGDCWAFSDVAGFPPQVIDFSESADKWYQPDVRSSFDLAV